MRVRCLKGEKVDAISSSKDEDMFWVIVIARCVVIGGGVAWVGAVSIVGAGVVVEGSGLPLLGKGLGNLHGGVIVTAI